MGYVRNWFREETHILMESPNTSFIGENYVTPIVINVLLSPGDPFGNVFFRHEWFLQFSHKYLRIVTYDMSFLPQFNLSLMQNKPAFWENNATIFFSSLPCRIMILNVIDIIAPYRDIFAPFKCVQRNTVSRYLSWLLYFSKKKDWQSLPGIRITHQLQVAPYILLLNVSEWPSVLFVMIFLHEYSYN